MHYVINGIHDLTGCNWYLYLTIFGWFLCLLLFDDLLTVVWFGLVTTLVCIYRSMSVVLTALLASGLMWPVCMRIQRQVWELKVSFFTCVLAFSFFAFETFTQFFRKLDFAYEHSESEESDADM